MHHTCVENRDGQDESFAPPSCETRTSPPALTTTKLKSKLDGSSQSILGSIIGCTIVASALVFPISLAAAVYKCHKKKQRSPLNYTSDGKLDLPIAVFLKLVIVY